MNISFANSKKSRTFVAALLSVLFAWTLLIESFGAHRQTTQTQQTPPAAPPAIPPVAQKPIPPLPSPKGSPESLSAADFSKISDEISEPGGYFRSDNFTSNETPYLHIVDKLKQIAQPGGAYIGVGPEQNFTYISKVRPRIAFIIDIRRQAIIQHLMYKAIFQHSPTRAQFLSLLLSRPIAKDKKFTADTPLPELVAYFAEAQPDEKAYTANLALIRKTLKDDVKYPLTDQDQAGLEYIYKNFYDRGLDISYQMAGMGGFRSNMFPGLREILMETDLNGKLGNFLAAKDDYDFVRDMHRRNMIIPVVGDFAGPKALAGIGDYLKKNNYTVTAYYLSNVEQYLFQDNIFGAFANNVRKLPITDKSLMIRSISGRATHPARQPDHRSVTLMEQIAVFLKDVDAGAYQSYNDLANIHYIAP
jgi:hypothetical protein